MFPDFSSPSMDADSYSHSVHRGEEERRMDTFNISGPRYLTSVNWNSADHRRVVAASLVKSVYVLEWDRQKNVQGADALAPPWWEFFHFQLQRTLVDAVDSSIFGAIFEFEPDMGDAPQYVIAFRGTIPKGESLTQDLRLDLDIIKNKLHHTSRMEMAMREVRSVASESSNMWIAGHSLGSAIAMLAGKAMARTGIFLEAFLFNSPFISAPIESIKHERVRHKIRAVDSRIKARLVLFRKGNPNPDVYDPFMKLSAWLPSLFVHPADHICSEYVGYFKHRKEMEGMGGEAGNIERLASHISLTTVFFSFLGNETEPLHLLPSAALTTNLTPVTNHMEAHGIHQWWKQDLHLQTDLYQY